MTKDSLKELAIEYIPKNLGNTDYLGLLTSNKWNCRDDIGDDGEWVEELSSIFQDISPIIVITLKLSLIYKNSIRFDGKYILSKRHTLVIFLARIKWFCTQIRPLKLDRLSDMNESEIILNRPGLSGGSIT